MFNIFGKAECNSEEKRLFVAASSKGNLDAVKLTLENKDVDIATKAEVNTVMIAFRSK